MQSGVGVVISMMAESVKGCVQRLRSAVRVGDVLIRLTGDEAVGAQAWLRDDNEKRDGATSSKIRQSPDRGSRIFSKSREARVPQTVQCKCSQVFVDNVVESDCEAVGVDCSPHASILHRTVNLKVTEHANDRSTRMEHAVEQERS
ncbi:uncharacterized protein LOC125959894 [Anopheles darlingi]|uniref:uncharacterized protein LOC125959894 n=1 Tax=Anopheles darlingi TaxID=43151 RepID=UPI002100129B|nr:uncharacterized protein LOC125959894 [Anopheles darlingi]